METEHREQHKEALKGFYEHTTVTVCTFELGVRYSLLPTVDGSAVRRASLPAVSEVTVRSVAPLSVGLELGGVRVKRALEASEEPGGSQHDVGTPLSSTHVPVQPCLFFL